MEYVFGEKLYMGLNSYFNNSSSFSRKTLYKQALKNLL